MELLDLMIELDRYCAREDFDKENTVRELIDHMAERFSEEE